MVGGKPYYGHGGSDGGYAEGEARRYKKAMRECLCLFVWGFCVVWCNSISGVVGLQWLWEGYEENLAEELDTLAEGWLEEHKRRRADLGENGKEEKDFMDVMLNVVEDDAEICGYDSDTIIKATCLVSACFHGC